MPIASNAADPPTAQKSGYLPSFFLPDETFSNLKKERRNVATEIEGIESELRRLESELSSIEQRSEYDSRRLAQIEEDLQLIDRVVADRSRPGFKPRTLIGGRAQSFSDYLYAITNNSELERERKNREFERQEISKRSDNIVQMRKSIVAKRTELPMKRDKLFDLEEKISDLLDTSRNQYFYRAGVSVIFAAIVFFLVLKFFRVVDSDIQVKQSIFAGDAGIQFITLFSIVIAVILFGILGILGANELSALLGGLSGYILGKTRSPTVTAAS